MKEEKDVFKEFEEEYGISLILDSAPTVVPTASENLSENLFEKIYRLLKVRKISCDMDIVEYKKYKKWEKIIKISILLLITILMFSIGSNISIIGGTSRCNIVAEPGATEPAFLGYKFTDELVAKIESGDIDLYDMYIVEDNNNNDINGIRIENKYGFKVENVRISDANYIEYSDEYINKMFSDEYIKSHEGSLWGYWEYTIDCRQ